MGTDVTGVVEALPSPRQIKVHRLMCTELIKLVKRILKIFPEIEESRPRCSSGIQALCLLNGGIEKAKSLLQHCTECSKLYLAITGDALLSRCKKARNMLERSLSEIQNMVPVMLAAEISRVISDLRGATFSLDSSEEEAGKVVRAFLQQYESSGDSAESSAFKAIRFAALRLQITTQKALLIEKRSIKNLLDKVGDVDPAKRKILLCLMDLLRRYGQSVLKEQAENASVQSEESFPFASSGDVSVEAEFCAEQGLDEATTDMSLRSTLPEEFKCPISSRLMYDPVVIASGETFERMWIQRWFDEGHDTCPKTNKKLARLSLTPNVAMKDLISKWCIANGVTIPDPSIQSRAVRSWETSSTSIASLSNSMNDLHLPVDFSNVSLRSLDGCNSDSSQVKIKDVSDLVSMESNSDSQRDQCCANMHEKNEGLLNNFDELPWECQCDVVEDVKNHLKHIDQAFHSMSLENFVEPLVRFLKTAYALHDVKALRTGTQLLLAFVSMSGSSVPSLYEEAYGLLSSFLESEVIGEALAIMEVLSCYQGCRPKIAASGALYSMLKILETQLGEFVEPAIKILYNFSLSGDVCSLIVPSDFIPKLVPLFKDDAFARYCILILKNLCHDEGVRVSVAETDGCISSIAKLLESRSREVQEHALTVLLSLCSQRVQYCQLVMEEGVIPDLVSISINGNEKGKAGAMELLRLLRDIEFSDIQECSKSDLDLHPDVSRESSKQGKEKRPSSKASGFFGMKLSIFSKSSSFATRKKK